MHPRVVLAIALSCSLASGFVAAVATVILLDRHQAASSPTSFLTEPSRRPPLPTPILNGDENESVDTFAVPKSAPKGRTLARIEVKDGKIVSVTPVNAHDLQVQAQEAEPPPSPGAIELSCQLPHRVFSPVDPPSIRVTLRNAGPVPLSVPLNLDSKGNLLPGGFFSVILMKKIDGDTATLRSPLTLSTPRWLDISPKEERTLMVQLGAWFPAFTDTPNNMTGDYIPVIELSGNKEGSESLELPNQPKGKRWWGSIQFSDIGIFSFHLDATQQ